MTRSASARTGRRISRSSIWPACAPSRISRCFARPTRSRRRNAGSWRSAPASFRRCWRVTLLATGSEVAVAMAARELLKGSGVAAAVVSLPCWSLFDAQDAAYRASVLGAAPRIAIEAASPFGWERYVGEGGTVLGMTGFGASAPAEDLFRHFGLTAEKLAAAALARLGH